MQDVSQSKLHVVNLVTNNPDTDLESVTFELYLENQVDLIYTGHKIANLNLLCKKWVHLNHNKSG